MFAAQTQACIIVISVYKKEDKIVILYLVENFKDVRTTVAGKLKNPWIVLPAGSHNGI